MAIENRHRLEMVAPAAGSLSNTFDCLNAGPYVFDYKIQMPSRARDGGANSAMVLTITNTTQSTTIQTGKAGSDGGRATAVCAVGDVITFALSSASGGELAQISISQGVS